MCGHLLQPAGRAYFDTPVPLDVAEDGAMDLHFARLDVGVYRCAFAHDQEVGGLYRSVHVAVDPERAGEAEFSRQRGPVVEETFEIVGRRLPS